MKLKHKKACKMIKLAFKRWDRTDIKDAVSNYIGEKKC